MMVKSDHYDVEEELFRIELVRKKSGKYSIFAFDGVDEPEYRKLQTRMNNLADKRGRVRQVDAEERELIEEFLKLREKIKAIRVRQAGRGDSGKGLVTGI